MNGERSSEQLAEELARAIRIRDDFISVASHELKTPLTSLQLQLDGVARALREREGGESKLCRKIATAIRQTDRLTALVDDLLAVSAITQGRFKIERSNVDLERIVREAVDAFQEEAALANSTLTLRTSGPVRLSADPLRIGRVVQNLVSTKATATRSCPSAITASASARKIASASSGASSAPFPSATTADSGWGSSSATRSSRRTAARSASSPPTVPGAASWWCYRPVEPVNGAPSRTRRPPRRRSLPGNGRSAPRGERDCRC
jgi:hypothetical protein